MGQNQGSGVVGQGAAYHLPRVYAGAIDGAVKQLFVAAVDQKVTPLGVLNVKDRGRVIQNCLQPLLTRLQRFLGQLVDEVTELVDRAVHQRIERQAR